MNSNKKSLKDKYVKLEQVASGTYGIVYKGKNKETNQLCAIKKFKNLANEGLPASAVREINVIKSINSPYILPILDIYIKKSSIKMVTPWKNLTLQALIDSSSAFQTKKLLYQLIKGLHSIHAYNTIHRDLKPANIVIDDCQQYNLKIIDFGMAKKMPFKQKNTPHKLTIQVGTSYYRAPQLLTKKYNYDQKIDIWSLGCIFYQLMTRKILFKDTNQLTQLTAIYSQIASTAECQQLSEKFPVIASISDSGKWQKIQENITNSGFSKGEINLLKSILRVNPNERPSCSELLKNQYFQTI